MPLFSRTVEPGTPFKKNEVVKATIDLPGVPSGTSGKIKMINGFDWRRYWVFFDNGVEMGQLDTGELVRPAHWDHYFTEKARLAEAARAAEAAQESASNGEVAATAATGDSDDPLAALRAMIPAHLAERSKAAKARLSG